MLVMHENGFELEGLNPAPLCSCSLTFAIISVSFLTEKQKIQHEALVSQNRHIRRKNLLNTLLWGKWNYYVIIRAVSKIVCCCVE
jgi:hypothetical protein